MLIIVLDLGIFGLVGVWRRLVWVKWVVLCLLGLGSFEGFVGLEEYVFYRVGGIIGFTIFEGEVILRSLG